MALLICCICILCLYLDPANTCMYKPRWGALLFNIWKNIEIIFRRTKRWPCFIEMLTFLLCTNYAETMFDNGLHMHIGAAACKTYAWQQAGRVTRLIQRVSPNCQLPKHAYTINNHADRRAHPSVHTTTTTSLQGGNSFLFSCGFLAHYAPLCIVEFLLPLLY